MRDLCCGAVSIRMLKRHSRRLPPTSGMRIVQHCIVYCMRDDLITNEPARSDFKQRTTSDMSTRVNIPAEHRKSEQTNAFSKHNTAPCAAVPSIMLSRASGRLGNGIINLQCNWRLCGVYPNIQTHPAQSHLSGKCRRYEFAKRKWANWTIGISKYTRRSALRRK